MKIQVIGSGAAGNKAVICALNTGVVNKDSIMLINSTSKDIPSEYENYMTTLAIDSFGCAKERISGRNLTIEAIKSGRLNLEQWVDPTTDIVVLTGSTDGGTGSGSIPVLADYLFNQMKIQPHIVALNGFEDDLTGIKNTIQFYKELNENYTYQMICNTKFLKDANNNKIKAQELANAEFCNRLMMLQGLHIIESENNVDDADLFKTVVTPGFMNIEYAEFNERIKNVDDFNVFLNKMCDDSKSFDIIEPSQKRMAVVVNLNTTPNDAIDWKFNVLRERYGHVKELFTHLQNNEQPEFVSFISAGMNFPEHMLSQIYKSYEKERETTRRKEDTFFSGNKDKFVLDDDEEDSTLYKPAKTTATSKSVFFEAEIASTREKEKKFINKNNVDVKNEY